MSRYGLRFEHCFLKPKRVARLRARGLQGLLLGLLVLTFLLSSCRSQADHVAEFCLAFEAQIESSDDCATMAKNLAKLLDESPSRHYAEGICRDTTACLPCKKASLRLLGRCGHDDDMRPILDAMHFSNALRQESAVESQN